jgi:hypothetical protein
MLDLTSSIMLAGALKRSIKVPYKKLDISNFKPLDPVKWQDFNFNHSNISGLITRETEDDEDSYFGYSTSNLNVVRYSEDSEEDLPVLGDDDILFFTITEAHSLNIWEKLEGKNVKRLKLLEGDRGLKNIESPLSLGIGFEGVREVCFGKFRSLERVDGDMFLNCNSLTSVSFSGLNSLISIGGCMFKNCRSLVNVSFDGLTSLGSVEGDLFHECYSLMGVSFEALTSLKSVKSLFNTCYSLKSISFERLSSLETVRGSIFHMCHSLTHAFFDGLSSLRIITDSIFSACGSLRRANLHGLSSLETVEGPLITACWSLEVVYFSGLNSLTNVNSEVLINSKGPITVSFRGLDKSVEDMLTLKLKM